MARRKRKVTPVSSTTAPPKARKEPWYKRTWIVAAAFSSAAFTLGMNGPTILQNMRKIPAEVELTRDQYMSWWKEDAEWSGDWSAFPEGFVDMADMKLTASGDLKISLQAKNGKLDGMIAIRKACEAIPFDFLLVRGSVSGPTAKIEVWDIDGGRQIVFGQLKLVKENNVITVQSAGGAS